MPIVLTDSKYYDDIATAINEKTGQFNQYTPAEMAFAIREKLGFIPPPPLFEWGDEIAVADAKWWDNLSYYINTLNPNELKQFLGKTKKVTLTKGVLGTTTHLVRCIGYNLDRYRGYPSANTLTFQTANCLAQTTAFGSSNAYWRQSIVLQKCQDYYNAFPNKSVIATVEKGTCTSTNSSQSGTPTYYNETVFLPADCEMGFPKGHNSSNGQGFAASYDEFCRQNSSGTPYQYYTSNQSRIKKLGDSGSNQHYWERSLYYDYTTGACRVSNDGKPYDNFFADSLGFAPAFCVYGRPQP